METKALKAAVTALNKAEIEGHEMLKIVGVKTAVLQENFLQAIEALDDAGKGELIPEECTNAYNTLVEEKENPPAEKPKKEKAAKKAKPTSRYGHQPEKISGKLDEALFEGDTCANLMKKLDISRARVMSHVKHLVNDLGLTLVETKPEGEDVKLVDTHYKIKEESYTAPAKESK